MKEKLPYKTVEDLIHDLAFLDWARGSSQDTSRWENPLSQKEIMEARKWIRSLHFKEDPVPKNKKSELWSQIDQATQAPTKIRRLGRRTVLGIAASLAFFIAAGWWMISQDRQTYTTEMAEVMKVQLPDASLVQLNAASELAVVGNWDDSRALSLKGEGFFEVKKGSEFSVRTSNGVVSVLGTSFNVLSRDDLFEVHCHTGKVQVDHSGQQVILTPGQSTRLVDDILQKVPFKVDHEKTWMKGYHLFEAQPLSQVFQELERQFDVKVSLPTSVNDQVYTGFFTNDNLQVALQAVCWPLRYQFEIEGKKVRIFEEEK